MRGIHVVATIELGGHLGQQGLAFAAQLAVQGVERVGILAGTRIAQFLAPFHLLHQEADRHGRVRLRLQVDAIDLAQVLRALLRAFQGLVGFIGARGPLHGDALFGAAGIDEAVGMDLALHVAVSRVERMHVERELRRQLE